MAIHLMGDKHDSANHREEFTKENMAVNYLDQQDSTRKNPLSLSTHNKYTWPCFYNSEEKTV